MSRFHCPDFETGHLGPEESHHAVQVLRLKDGETIGLFDGRGTEAKARLLSADKKQATYQIISRHRTPDPGIRVHLGQAIVKTKAMELVIQKATELGVSHIHPILSDRSVAAPGAEQIDTKADKWRLITMEACKQCGQNHLPEVDQPRDMTGFLDAQRAWGGVKIIGSLQPNAKPLHQVLENARESAQLTEATILIGPEGDFTPAEIGAALSAGFQPVSLGPLILRTETAALYTLSALLYESRR